MNKNYSFYILMFLFISCTNNKIKEESVSFSEFKKNYVNEYLTFDAHTAVKNGKLEYNSILNLTDYETFNSKIKWYKLQGSIINKIEYQPLNEVEKIEFGMIQNDIEKRIWELEVFKRHEWDPTFYSLKDYLIQTLQVDLPLHIKLTHLNSKLKALPQYYSAAKNNINNPSKIHLERSIPQLKAEFKQIKTIAIDSLNLINSNIIKTELVTNLTNAEIEVNSFIDFLKEKEKTVHLKNSSIGETNYNKLFQLRNFTSLNATEFYKNAKIANIQSNKKIEELVPGLWKKYFPNEPTTIDFAIQISKLKKVIFNRRIQPNEFEDFTVSTINYLEKFVKEKKIIDTPTDYELKIVFTPNYLNDLPFGNLYLDTDSKQIDFFVANFQDWEKDKAMTGLKDYSPFFGLIYLIHETTPGHFTQFALKKGNSYIVNNHFKNINTLEGWAMYAEKIMVEHGVGELVGQEELEFYFYTRHYRLIQSALIDYEIHVNQWTLEQLIEFGKTDNLSKKACELFWAYSLSNPLQLTNYYYGLSEIESLKNEMQLKEGEFFELREFHENFLSYGNIPINLIRLLMIEKLK